MAEKQKYLIACDHGGTKLKALLMERFSDCVEWIDLGADGSQSVDYPDYAQKLARALTSGQAEKGVLICGSGIGISIAANRFPAVRAALCVNETMARLCRQHNDANVLVLGERVTGQEVACDCFEVFMSTDFEGGRHQGRVDKLAVQE